MEAGFDLERFLDAQDRGGAYEAALAELRAGRKRSHWIWFVLPQLRQLGRSPTARAYGIAGIEEARAYLAHPVLGPRLRQCAEALLGLETASAEAVLGTVDALKLRSSMTLFAHAAPNDPLYPSVLQKFYAGQPDDATNRLLTP